jgi:hypothetical protein
MGSQWNCTFETRDKAKESHAFTRNVSLTGGRIWVVRPGRQSWKGGKVSKIKDKFKIWVFGENEERSKEVGTRCRAYIQKALSAVPNGDQDRDRVWISLQGKI